MINIDEMVKNLKDDEYLVGGWIGKKGKTYSYIYRTYDYHGDTKISRCSFQKRFKTLKGLSKYIGGKVCYSIKFMPYEKNLSAIGIDENMTVFAEIVKELPIK
jgi:hypothetical protein